MKPIAQRILMLPLLAATLTLATASFASSPWNGGPIRLLYTTSGSYRMSSVSYGNTRILAHAKNIGNPASRATYAHTRCGSYSPWETFAMTKLYEDTTHSTYELNLSCESAEFVVKYVTDIGTFWDNNNWANYPVRACYYSCDGSEEMFVGGNTGLVKATLRSHREGYGSGSTALYGDLAVDIEVENLNYNKKVGVRATFDNGNTWNDTDAQYVGGEQTGVGYTHSIERWRATAFGLISGAVKFAIYYRDLDGGGEYWDNNFTQDYRPSVIEGSTTTMY